MANQSSKKEKIFLEWKTNLKEENTQLNSDIQYQNPIILASDYA